MREYLSEQERQALRRAVRFLVKEYHLSQNRIAEHAKIGSGTICQILRGHSKGRASTLERLARSVQFFIERAAERRGLSAEEKDTLDAIGALLDVSSADKGQHTLSHLELDLIRHEEFTNRWLARSIPPLDYSLLSDAYTNVLVESPASPQPQMPGYVEVEISGREGPILQVAVEASVLRLYCATRTIATIEGNILAIDVMYHEIDVEIHKGNRETSLVDNTIRGIHARISAHKGEIAAGVQQFLALGSPEALEVARRHVVTNDKMYNAIWRNYVAEEKLPDSFVGPTARQSARLIVNLRGELGVALRRLVDRATPRGELGVLSAAGAAP